MSVVPGLRRLKIDLNEIGELQEGERHWVIYYEMNLAEMSRATIHGDHLAPGARPGGYWAWDVLANFLLCRDRRVPLEAAEIDSVVRTLYDEPRNEPYRAYFEAHGIRSHVPSASDSDDADPIATREPMILMFRDDAFFNGSFSVWYRRRVLFGTGTNLMTEIGATQTYFTDFRKKYLAPLLAATSAFELGVLKPLVKLISQLQMGEAVFTALRDFTRPVAERKEIWRDGLDSDRRADSDFVVPLPSRARIEAIHDVHVQWTKATRLLLEIAHRETTASAQAKAREKAAKRLLDQLRKDGEPVVRMLENADLLSPEEHQRMSSLLVDSFTALTKSPWAVDELCRGEFAAVGQAAAAAGSKAPPFDPDTPREHLVAAAIANLDAAKELPVETESAIAKRLAGFFAAAKSTMSTTAEYAGQSVVLDILALASPFLARKLGLRGGDTVSVAWAWRTLVGSAMIRPGAARRIWREIRTIVRRERPPLDRALLNHERGALAAALDGLTSNVAWKAARMLTTIVVATEAASALAGETVEDAVEGFSLMLSSAKAATGLAMIDPHKCVILSRFLDASETSKDALRKAGGTATIDLLGPLADVTSFVASILELRGGAHKIRMLSRDLAHEKVMLDGISLALTALGMALGAELVLASFVLFLGQNVLLNRDVWAALLPGIVPDPGPQKFLAALAHEVNTHAFIASLRAAGETQSLDKALRLIFDAVDTPTSSDPDRRTFWDIGGAPGEFILFVDAEAEGILTMHYGIHAEAAHEIVRKSQEV